MDIDSFTESLQQEDLNETALRVLNLLFILNASATPLSTEQILRDSDLGYGSANRASDLKKFKRDREKLAEHGVSIVEVRPAGAKQTEESLWTIDRANTYATLGIITQKDADTLLRAVDECLARKEIPYRRALISIRHRLHALTHPLKQSDSDGADGRDADSRAAIGTAPSDRIADALWSAYTLKRKVRFAYRDARGRDTSRTMAIWGIFTQHGHSYYVGLDEQSGGVRTFRGDRITRVWRPSGNYTIPRWFNIHDYLFLPFDMAGGMTTAVSFWFPDGIGQAEIESLTKGRGTLERRSDTGAWIWTVKVSDMRAAAQFALAHAQMGMRPQSPRQLVDAWNTMIDKAVESHG